MPQIFCEVCGGVNVVKQDGVFTCQDCGCKYSLEEMRNLVSGQIREDEPDEVDSVEEILLEEEVLSGLMRVAFESNNFTELGLLVDKALNQNPQNFAAILYKACLTCYTAPVETLTGMELKLLFEEAIRAMYQELGETEEYFEMFVGAMSNYMSMTDIVRDRITSEMSFESRYQSVSKQTEVVGMLLNNLTRFFELSDELVVDKSKETSDYKVMRQATLYDF